MAEVVTSCDAGGRGAGRFETGARLEQSSTWARWHLLEELPRSLAAEAVHHVKRPEGPEIQTVTNIYKRRHVFLEKRRELSSNSNSQPSHKNNYKHQTTTNNFPSPQWLNSTTALAAEVSFPNPSL